MAAAGAHRLAALVPILLTLLLLLLVIQYGASHATTLGSSSSGHLVRNLLGIVQRNTNQIPNCNDMSSEPHCSRNPNCRWCRSDALDDMCFSKNEAWRLPHQVFSCN